MSEPSYEYRIALVEREIHRLLLDPPTAYRDEKISKLRGMQRGIKAEQIVITEYESGIKPYYHGYEAEYQEKLQKSIDEAVVKAVVEGVQAAPPPSDILYSEQPYSEEFASMEKPPVPAAPTIQLAGFSPVILILMAGIAYSVLK